MNRVIPNENPTIFQIAAGITTVVGMSILKRQFPRINPDRPIEESDLQKKARKIYEFFSKNSDWVQIWGLVLGGAALCYKLIEMNTYLTLMFNVVVIESGLRSSRKTPFEISKGPTRPIICYSSKTDVVGTIYIPLDMISFPKTLSDMGISPATSEQIDAQKQRALKGNGGSMGTNEIRESINKKKQNKPPGPPNYPSPQASALSEDLVPISTCQTKKSKRYSQ